MMKMKYISSEYVSKGKNSVSENEDDLANQGPVSISDKTSYRRISWSLEAAIFVFKSLIVLKFDSTAAAVPVKFQNNTTI